MTDEQELQMLRAVRDRGWFVSLRLYSEELVNLRCMRSELVKLHRAMPKGDLKEALRRIIAIAPAVPDPEDG